jgi:Fe-S cluster assembly protein SufD
MTLTESRPHSSGTGPTGSPAERFTSRDPEAFDTPSRSDENWRFSPVRALRAWFEPFEPDLVVESSASVPDGARVESTDPQTLPAFGSVLTPADRASAVAMSGARNGTHTVVRGGAELDEAIVIARIGRSGRGYTHDVIDVGPHARATVVFDYRGALQVSGNVEVTVGDGAELSIIALYDCEPSSVVLAAHAAKVGRDATYRHLNLALGGSVVRIVPTVEFGNPGGRAELLGVGFAGDGQHFESRLFIDHSVPNCSSNVLYKNALLGESSRTVWIGDVRIRPGAIGTNTYELNRNLLLSDGARADSVPNLEIETGEIAGAGHASATGRFDDLQLFYLQSRGIPEDEARRLVVRGFFAEIIDRVPVPELQQRLMTSIERRLASATSATDMLYDSGSEREEHRS